MFGADFVSALAPHHVEAITWHWEARMAQRRGEPVRYDAYIAPWSRGHMKSTLARRLAVCDACLGVTDRKGGYCLYVSGTKDKVRGHALSLETLITSAKVIEHYPALARVRKSEAKTSKGWTRDFIYTDAGYVFHFVSLDEGVAGANVDNVRPTLIVPDDIDDRKSSPAVCEKRFQIFTREVLPTKQKGTLFYLAQNLVSRFGVVYRILKQKVRALTNRFPTKPVPAFHHLTWETRTVDGMVKDILTGGEPTWPVFDLARGQEDVDVYGIEAFLIECQHNVERQKTGLILPEWDEKVHLITWSQFYAVYGQREIPRHWQKYVGHDWGNTHPCTVNSIAVSAQNSTLPGLHFLWAGMTFPANTMADDVALGVIGRFNPKLDLSAMRNLPAELLKEWSRNRITDILNAPREVAVAEIRGQVNKWLTKDQTWALWHMSHEQKTVRTTYQSIYGLPFTACNPGADGGIEQLRHFLRVDYTQPHPFKPGERGLAGFYVIVADDQLEEARDDFGFKLLRDQWPEWIWRDVQLTELGLQADKPIKVNDDVGNSLMMIYVHFQTGATPLSDEERDESRLPDYLRDLAKLQEGDNPDGRIAARRHALAVMKQERDEEEGGNAFDIWNNSV